MIEISHELKAQLDGMNDDEIRRRYEEYQEGYAGDDGGAEEGDYSDTSGVSGEYASDESAAEEIEADFGEMFHFMDFIFIGLALFLSFRIATGKNA
jgi:hypothetical protein